MGDLWKATGVALLVAAICGLGVWANVALIRAVAGCG